VLRINVFPLNVPQMLTVLLEILVWAILVYRLPVIHAMLIPLVNQGSFVTMVNVFKHNVIQIRIVQLAKFVLPVILAPLQFQFVTLLMIVNQENIVLMDIALPIRVAVLQRVVEFMILRAILVPIVVGVLMEEVLPCPRIQLERALFTIDALLGSVIVIIVLMQPHAVQLHHVRE
jgi:hypothetical protein